MFFLLFFALKRHIFSSTHYNISTGFKMWPEITMLDKVQWVHEQNGVSEYGKWPPNYYIISLAVFRSAEMCFHIIISSFVSLLVGPTHGFDYCSSQHWSVFLL